MQLKIIEILLKEAVLDIKNNKKDDAIDKLKKINLIDENNILSNFYLGNLHFEKKEFEDSLKFLKKAISLKSNFAEAYNTIGLVYKNLNDLNKARKSFENSIKFNKNLSDPYNNLGILRRDINDIKGAKENFLKSNQIKDDYFPAYINLLQLYERLNDLDSLKQLIQKCETKFNNNSIIKLYKGKLQYKIKEYDNSISTLENLKFDDSQQFLEKSRLSQLAKSYEKNKNYEKSFEYFKKLNEYSFKLLPKNTNKSFFLNQIKIRNDFFQYNKKISWPSENDENDLTPVFLIGFPRSGTTLLNTILKSHEKIITVDEKNTVEILIEKLRELTNNNFENLKKLSKNNLKLLKVNYFDQISKFVNGNYKNTVVIDKMPLNIIYIGEILRVFPNSKFIFLLRDPRDSVLSCYFQDFLLNNAMSNFLTINDTINLYDAVMNLWKNYNNIFQFNSCIIKYEDLVLNFDSTTSKILNFLNLPWSNNLYNFNLTAKNEGLIATPSYDQIIEPLNKNAIGRHKYYQKYIEKIGNKLQPWCEYFDY